jgi:hypothetical protein
VPEPGLELEQRHWFFGVVELAGDRRPAAVAGDLTGDVAAAREPLRTPAAVRRSGSSGSEPHHANEF